MTIAWTAEENPVPTEPQNEPEETPEETNESKLEEFFKSLRKRWNQTQNEVRESTLIGSIAASDEDEKKAVLEFLPELYVKYEEFAQEAYEKDSAKTHIKRFENIHFKGFEYNKESVFEMIRDLQENTEDLESLKMSLIVKIDSTIYHSKLTIEEQYIARIIFFSLMNELDSSLEDELRLEKIGTTKEMKIKFLQGVMELLPEEFPADRTKLFVTYWLELLDLTKAPQYIEETSQGIFQRFQCLCRSKDEPQIKKDPRAFLQVFKNNVFCMQEAFWSGEAKYVEEFASKHYKIIMAHIKNALEDGKFWEGKQYLIENFGVYDLNQATLKTKPFKEQDLQAFLYFQQMTSNILKPVVNRLLDICEAKNEEMKQKRKEQVEKKLKVRKSG